jgi:hypothetical protein
MTTGTVPDGLTMTKTPLTKQGTGAIRERDIALHPDKD